MRTCPNTSVLEVIFENPFEIRAARDERGKCVPNGFDTDLLTLETEFTYFNAIILVCYMYCTQSGVTPATGQDQSTAIPPTGRNTCFEILNFF